jgi:hypothetical protein
MLFVIAFDFHVSERFKHFVERRKILAIARFILCAQFEALLAQNRFFSLDNRCIFR